MSEKPVAPIKTLARYEPDTVYIGTGEYVAECVRADDGDYYLAADVDAAIEALRAEVELWRHKAAVHQYRRKRLAEALRDARRALAFAAQHLPECNEPYERANDALALEDRNG